MTRGRIPRAGGIFLGLKGGDLVGREGEIEHVGVLADAGVRDGFGEGDESLE